MTTDRPPTHPGSPSPATASARFRMTWATSAAGSPVPVSFEYDDAPPRLQVRDFAVLVCAVVCLAVAVAAFWQLVST